MWLKKMVTIVLIVSMFFLIGCAAHIHKVGQGAKGTEMVQKRQWYALWGLVPLNHVDTNQMANGSTDYTIKTEHSALDIIINIFTSYVTVVSRTVTVTK